MDGSMDGRVDGWMDGQMHERKDGQLRNGKWMDDGWMVAYNDP